MAFEFEKVVKFDELPTTVIKRDDMPFRFRISPHSMKHSRFILFGDLWFPDANGGNAFVEEKQVSGHICRLLQHAYYHQHCYGENYVVDRDDGTMWTVGLNSFKELYRIEVDETEWRPS